jgi:hypothetical protein
MALSMPPNHADTTSNKPKFDETNLPNQNAHEAMKYSLKQGVVGGMYGLAGSSIFSLLANRFCTFQLPVRSLFYFL